jgi:sugar (pentulose or hexulose) kinase
VLEGTAAALGDQLRTAREVSGHAFDLVVSTGGPTRSALWNRLDAAAAGATVAVAPLSDAAVGGALIAAEATGLVDSAIRCGTALRKGAPVFEPEPELVARAEQVASELAPVRDMALVLARGPRALG